MRWGRYSKEGGMRCRHYRSQRQAALDGACLRGCAPVPKPHTFPSSRGAETPRIPPPLNVPSRLLDKYRNA